MIVVQHEAMAKRLRKLRAFGRVGLGNPNVSEFGLNYRMTEMQAAIGIQQLRKLPAWLGRRQTNWNELAGRLPLPALKDNGGLCYALAVEVSEYRSRDELRAFLSEQGVETSVYYPILVPKLTFYEHRLDRQERKYLNAERIASRSLCYPVGPHVGLSEIEFMALITNQWLTKKPVRNKNLVL